MLIGSPYCLNFNTEHLANFTCVNSQFQYGASESYIPSILSFSSTARVWILNGFPSSETPFRETNATMYLSIWRCMKFNWHSHDILTIAIITTCCKHQVAMWWLLTNNSITGHITSFLSAVACQARDCNLYYFHYCIIHEEMVHWPPINIMLDLNLWEWV